MDCFACTLGCIFSTVIWKQLVLDEVLFDKDAMVACHLYILCGCLKLCMQSVIFVFSVSYWFRYWDLQLLLTNVLGGGKNSSEIENLLLKIALTALSKISFLNGTIMLWFIYFCFMTHVLRLKSLQSIILLQNTSLMVKFIFSLFIQSLFQDTFFFYFW